ncbi:hypothetical protein [Halobacillus litoralis]|nr:hypothetical protein [Halobacillus litoralis]
MLVRWLRQREQREPEDPLGQEIFLTRLTEAVPATSLHRQAIRVKQQ